MTSGRRSRGFTLIELLVVIAIIGILAAMLFPVFARARESARKTQCLANVKNIAMAVQIYLTDYDAMPPTEHSTEALDFIRTVMDAQGGDCDAAAKGAANNPYLRFPVVFDEYIKSREVWHCPSAKVEKTFPILNPYAFDAKGDWVKAAQGLYDTGCTLWNQCQRPIPSGWGGSVTDSYAQQACSDGGGGFRCSVGVPESEYGLKTSAVNDVSRYLAVAETGPGIDLWCTTNVAYPDLCHAGCSSDWCNSGADWANCSSSRDCGMGDHRWGVDATFRQKYARHIGGSNLGFWDGHAKWMSAEAILFGAPDWRYYQTNFPDPLTLPIEGPVGICHYPL